jgi:hypothetical protein
MKWRFWILWILCNLAWLVGAPVLFGVWLGHEVQAEYMSGARVSTDGDSIGIPIYGFTRLNLFLVIAINLASGIYVFVKRRRIAQQRSGADAASSGPRRSA